MDSSMNTFISDQLHVAQQSRREKLRVQHCSPSRSGPRIDDYSSNFEVAQSGFNPDLIQVGDNMQSNENIMYHPTGCSSEMLNFFNSHCNTNSNGPRADQASGTVNSINMVTARDGSLKTRVESKLENRGVWKNVCTDSSADNWNADSIGRYRKNNSLGIVNGISAFDMKMKHQPIQSQYGDMNNFATQLHYQNALSDGITTAVLGLQPNCNAGGSTCISWGGYVGDNENVYQSSDGACLLSGPSWNAEMSLLHSSSSSQLVVDSQGLSLSLCSYPAGSMMTGSQFGNSQHIPQSIPLHNVATVAFHDSKPCSPADFVRTTGVGQGAYLQESLGPSTNYHRQTGPLGPFTGYTTILKSSRFLQPAQQLLDEYCGVIGKFASSSTRAASDIDLGDSGDLATAVNSIVSDVVASGEYMGASAATPQDSGENSKGSANSPRESLRPDYQARKAKLLYMLEEVSRRYKQYYQQMQMVVAGFESVAGLAGATPYISLALKAVSRDFSHLKNTISDQLRQIKTFLREDFSLPHSGIRDKGDFNRKKLKYGDHSFQKHKSGGSSMGLFEPQQQIWRPQRGLPERAVSVLRAWLFEHFLHPYPTDNDKHMLATKTGLTRSQVSNWFINARVRLWKPMVEEVHMLETKFVAEKNINLGGDEDVSTNEANVHSNADRSLNQFGGSSKPSVNLECPATTGSLYEMTGDVRVAKEHNQEKHAQVDSHNVTSMNEGLFAISRYHQTAHDISSIGSISLTLGLRQSADQVYRFEGNQHQPYLQHQDRIRQHLGGHATEKYAG